MNEIGAGCGRSRIALGAAQFGMAYGIANQAGQLSEAEGAAILQLARQAGVDTIDTAIAYGTSEDRLGDHGMAGWRVVSKLPSIAAAHGDVSAWVQASIEGSLRRLRVPSLYGLLLHRPEELLGHDGPRLYRELQDLKARGAVAKIGVSVYEPQELDAIVPRFEIDLVQAPFNVFDRRLQTSGWTTRLSELGVELHTRSAFLQGLLLATPDRRPAFFGRWATLWAKWDRWLADTGQSPLHVCLGHVLAEPLVQRVVVGVDGVRQLSEILESAARPLLTPPPVELSTDDPDLLHPFRWSSP